jgi:hypothetical protein
MACERWCAHGSCHTVTGNLISNANDSPYATRHTTNRFCCLRETLGERSPKMKKIKSDKVLQFMTAYSVQSTII